MQIPREMQVMSKCECHKTLEGLQNCKLRCWKKGQIARGHCGRRDLVFWISKIFNILKVSGTPLLWNILEFQNPKKPYLSGKAVTGSMLDGKTLSFPKKKRNKSVGPGAVHPPHWRWKSPKSLSCQALALVLAMGRIWGKKIGLQNFRSNLIFS